LNGGFLGTAASAYADMTLLLEIGMGVGLLIGALLARRRRYRGHAWCQSVIVLLNLGVAVFTMIPSFRVHVSPKIPLKLGKAYYALATAHAALGSMTEIAGETPHHQIQGLDANCTCALVVRAFSGIRNLRPVVRAAFVSEMKSEDVFINLFFTRVR
jgi:hypothetical protein